MNKQLHHVWLPILCAVMLSACTKYQYATVSSPLKQSNNRSFIHENDSIRVVYNFQGEGGPVKIAVHNKLDTPMFVSWRMSSMIVAGKSQSYYDNTTEIQGNGTGTTIDWGQGIRSTNSSFSGSMTHDDDVSFIPPGSYITALPANLKGEFFKFDPTINPGRKTLNSLSGPVNGRNYTFNSNNSPLHYQSYLTYSTDTNFASIATVEDNFWISEIVNTFANPDTIMDREHQDNTFHNSELTAFGAFVALIGLVGLLVIAAVPE